MIWSPRRGHADATAMFFERLSIVQTTVLLAPIGVMDQSTRVAHGCQSHMQCMSWTSSLQGLCNIVSNDFAAPEICYQRQVAEPTPESDVGLIGHPDLVGSICCGFRQHVRVDWQGVVAVGRYGIFASPFDQEPMTAQNVKELVTSDAEVWKMSQQLPSSNTRHELTKG